MTAPTGAAPPAAARPPVTAAPPAGGTAAVKREGMLPQTYPMPSTMNMNESERENRLAAWRENANSEEKVNRDRFNLMNVVSNGPNYTELKDLYNRTLKEIEGHKDWANDVLNSVRQLGPIAVTLDNGVMASLGNFAAQFRIPVAEAISSTWSEEKQSYANKLYSMLTILASAELAARGMSTSNSSQQEYNTQLKAAAAFGDTADSAMNKLRRGRAHVDEAKETVDTYNAERRRVNPQSITPYTDIQKNSQALRDLTPKWAKIRSAIP